MVDTKSLQQQAKEALDKVTEVTNDTYNAFKESDVGKKVLGEDGKFGEDDFNRLKDQATVVANKVKDTVVGEDGKFDQDDKDRLSAQANNLLDKAKNLFNK